ncbi:LysR family transcriptional regulator [Novosphingobium decolorationis]|uniref:LysR family transcriptional regulator n=1 Tax=Novosphingobium decolorationis TaxID=2698673 RepID=A0ABX8E787_9SPHN|nr:LysR family transcriptional regulator [Novosphingobium decolorationis]QVM85035.1 LysR family transcriptional regulator [Novosphingobium decolorationis]
MPDLVFDLRYLKYAMAVARHGSFRRAADALGLSQSTVSRRVQLLERRLGVPIFERNRTGTHLTSAGERFIREAEFGAERLHQAAMELGGKRPPGTVGGRKRPKSASQIARNERPLSSSPRFGRYGINVGGSGRFTLIVQGV